MNNEVFSFKGEVFVWHVRGSIKLEASLSAHTVFEL